MVHRLLLLGLAMALLSCSPSATAVPNSDWSNISFAPPLVLKLEVITGTPNAHRCLQAGESIKIRFTVTDDSNQSIILDSPDRPVLDMIIAEGSSMKIIYSWSDQNPSQVLHRIELQPGGSHSIEVQWIVPQKYQGLNMDSIFQGELSENGRIFQIVPLTLCLGIPFEQR